MAVANALGGLRSGYSHRHRESLTEEQRLRIVQIAYCTTLTRKGFTGYDMMNGAGITRRQFSSVMSGLLKPRVRIGKPRRVWTTVQDEDGRERRVPQGTWKVYHLTDEGMDWADEYFGGAA